MSHSPKTSREVRPVSGVLDPRCEYTVDGAMTAAGFGAARLAEGRQAGILHPESDGVRDWYRGEELIAFRHWLSSKKKKPLQRAG